MKDPEHPLNPDLWKESEYPKLPTVLTDPEYPDPTSEDLENPIFKAIWDAIKKWDISRYSDGIYSGPTGNDVMHILNKVHEPPVLHESQL